MNIIKEQEKILRDYGYHCYNTFISNYDPLLILKKVKSYNNITDLNNFK